MKKIVELVVGVEQFGNRSVDIRYSKPTSQYHRKRGRGHKLTTGSQRSTLLRPSQLEVELQVFSNRSIIIFVLISAIGVILSEDVVAPTDIRKMSESRRRWWSVDKDWNYLVSKKNFSFPPA